MKFVQEYNSEKHLTPVRNTKEPQPSLFDELKNRRRLINPSSDLFEENNFDDDDSKSVRSPTSHLTSGQLKYRYKVRNRKSLKEKQENWLPLGDWLVSKRDLGEGILNPDIGRIFT